MTKKERKAAEKATQAAAIFADRAARAEREAKWAAMSREQRDAIRLLWSLREIGRLDARSATEYEEMTRKFAADFAVNPADAIRWGAEHVCKAQFERAWLTRAFDRLRRSATFQALIEAVDEIDRELRDDLIRDLDGISSTCPIARAQAVWKHAARRANLGHVVRIQAVVEWAVTEPLDGGSSDEVR